MSVLASWLASPPPDAAVEISAHRVSVATLSARGDTFTVQRHASEVLPAGAVVPSLTSVNILHHASVVDALRRTFRELGESPRRVALVVPDLVAKVSLIRFDKVPARTEDLDQLVRWQVRKSAPFSIDEACVTYSPGIHGASGVEFVVALARRDVVEGYERVCADAGAHAGVVDLATMSVINLCVAQPSISTGDWLVVHMRPDYTSLAIMRGEHMIFFRNRPDSDGEALADLVHQTGMYYQDRLAGQGFARVLLGGAGGRPGAVEQARRNLETRLDVAVDMIDPTGAASLADRIRPTAEGRDLLTTLVGMLLRTRGRARAA